MPSNTEQDTKHRNEFMFEDKKYTKKDISEMTYYDIKNIIDRVDCEMERHRQSLRMKNSGPGEQWSAYLSFLIKFKTELRTELGSRVPKLEQAFMDAAKTLLPAKEYDELMALAELKIERSERKMNDLRVEQELERRVLRGL